MTLRLAELRAEVHQAVDKASREDLKTVLWMLEYLAGGEHPAKRAFQEADVDGPTPDEIETLDAYERRLAAGGCDWTTQEEVAKEFQEDRA